MFYIKFIFHLSRSQSRTRQSWIALITKQPWWRQWFGMWKERLHIHNMYIVVFKGTTNLLHSLRSCHSPRRHWSALCVESGESPQYIVCTVSRESMFWLPGNHSVNQSRVEYSSLELRQIALEQIRVLPVRLEVTDLLHPYSQPKAPHPQPSPYPQSSDKNFTTTTTPVCICNS
jgi:hypothetical protein